MIDKFKNLIQNFRYMSFSELRVFWVIVAAIVLGGSWFTLTTLQSKSDANVSRIAQVNKEMVKLTQNKEQEVETPYLADSKVKTAYRKGTPEQLLKDRIKLALDYVDGKDLLNKYNKNKSTLTGSIWSINAAGNTFTSPEWQSKAELDEYSQSIIDETVAQNPDGSYNIIVSVQPLGKNRESSQPMNYALHATVNGNVTNIDSLGTLEASK